VTPTAGPVDIDAGVQPLGNFDVLESLVEAVPPTLKPASKTHFRRLPNNLISETAIPESPCPGIKQNGEQSVECCKRNDL